MPKGYTPWNKDKKLGKNPRHSETLKRLYREGKIKIWNKGLKGIHLSPKTEFKKGQQSNRKGISTEEEYGKKRAKEIKEKISINRKDKCCGLENPSKRLEVRKELSKLHMRNKNPAWLGGKSFEPYGLKFNNKFKRFIRKRDNYICMLCGVHSEKLLRALTVHHVNYDKLLSIPQNCISLCVSCNSIVNKNRTKWTLFFQNLLKEKYDYKFSEDQTIILDFEKPIG